MAVCLSSLIFVGFPVKFHWPVSCQSNLSPDATERSVALRSEIGLEVLSTELPIGSSVKKY